MYSNIESADLQSFPREYISALCTKNRFSPIPSFIKKKKKLSSAQISLSLSLCLQSLQTLERNVSGRKSRFFSMASPTRATILLLLPRCLCLSFWLIDVQHRDSSSKNVRNNYNNKSDAHLISPRLSAFLLHLLRVQCSTAQFEHLSVWRESNSVG